MSWLRLRDQLFTTLTCKHTWPSTIRVMVRIDVYRRCDILPIHVLGRKLIKARVISETKRILKAMPPPELCKKWELLGNMLIPCQSLILIIIICVTGRHQHVVRIQGRGHVADCGCCSRKAFLRGMRKVTCTILQKLCPTAGISSGHVCVEWNQAMIP
eukprot:scaffold625_cov420-Prasinococcus_capsulatus_cf.AAC.42